MPQPQTQPTIYDYARALIAEKERNDALEAQNKALTDERDDRGGFFVCWYDIDYSEVTYLYF